jgi:hypothetical protein
MKTRIHDIVSLYEEHLHEIRVKREPFLVNGDWALLNCLIESIGWSCSNPFDYRALVAAMMGLEIWLDGMGRDWFGFDPLCVEEGFKWDGQIKGIKKRLKRELDEMKLAYKLDY